MPKLRKDVQQYAKTPNELLNNVSISLKAKGLFAFIESKPEDWEFSVRGMRRALKESTDAITAGLKELEEAGYLVRTKTRDKQGKWEVIYTLHDQPACTAYPLRETRARISRNGKPIEPTKKEAQRKTTKKEDTTAIAVGRKPEFGNPSINEMFNEWEQTVGYKIQSQMQKNRNACNNLLKRHGDDGLKRLMQGVARAQNDRYAPRISDFITLQAKFNDLLAWGRQQTSGVKVADL